MYTFFISSAIESDRGIFSHEEREQQTVETIDSIRKHVPDANIIIYESGSTLSEDRLQRLTKFATVIPLNNIGAIKQLSSQRLNSHAEAIASHIMMLNAEKFVPVGTKRIFKLSGRYKLQDTFDLSAYEDIGDKFVFKKRVKTWMDQRAQDVLGSDSLFDTRLYALTPALTEYYAKCLMDIYETVSKYGVDFEHAVFRCIDKSMVVEFDKVHCEGRIAPDGSLRVD